MAAFSSDGPRVRFVDHAHEHLEFPALGFHNFTKQSQLTGKFVQGFEAFAVYLALYYTTLCDLAKPCKMPRMSRLICRRDRLWTGNQTAWRLPWLLTATGPAWRAHGLPHGAIGNLMSAPRSASGTRPATQRPGPA